MLPDPKVKCPATGFARSCREIVAECDCPKFVKVVGVNPNDGQPVDRFGCVDSFLPMLLIENAMLQRQTGASADKVATEVQELRNTVVDLSKSQANGLPYCSATSLGGASHGMAVLPVGQHALPYGMGPPVVYRLPGSQD